jgi:hypothetical protein
VRQGSVDEVGEHVLDNGVAAVGDIGSIAGIPLRSDDALSGELVVRVQPTKANSAFNIAD